MPVHFGWPLYFALLAIRFAMVFRLQPGYLHPDEFFQSVEIAAGDVYPEIQVFRTWEFKLRDGGPVRSLAGIFPLAHLPVWLMKTLLPPKVHSNDAMELVGSTALEYILLPVRLAAVVITTMTVDLFILVASRLTESTTMLPSSSRVKSHSTELPSMQAGPPMALLLYSSASFGGLLLAGRSLANTWEMAAVSLFTILALVTIEQLTRSNELSYFHLLLLLSPQAILSVWAIFLRFTYIFFCILLALVEAVCLLWRLRRTSIMKNILLLTWCFQLASGTLITCLLVDTCYYSSVKDFWNLQLEQIICTPCKFYQYNSDPRQVAQHGLHPRYLHLLVNLPLILGPVTYVLALWPPKPFWGFSGLLWCNLVVPLLFLSAVPHQEPRFLLPLVPTALILAGCRLRNAFIGNYKRLIHLSIALWIVQQVCLAALYGSLHQSGVMNYAKNLPTWSADSCSTHVFFHTYMPPRFPFGLEQVGGLNRTLQARKCQCLSSVVDLAGGNQSDLGAVLRDWKLNASGHLDHCNVTLTLVYPGSLDFTDVRLTDYGEIIRNVSFFGHISTEELANLGPKFGSAKNFREMFNILASCSSLVARSIKPF